MKQLILYNSGNKQFYLTIDYESYERKQNTENSLWTDLVILQIKHVLGLTTSNQNFGGKYIYRQCI